MENRPGSSAHHHGGGLILFPTHARLRRQRRLQEQHHAQQQLEHPCARCGKNFRRDKNENLGCYYHDSEARSVGFGFTSSVFVYYWCCGSTRREAKGCKRGNHVYDPHAQPSHTPILPDITSRPTSAGGQREENAKALPVQKTEPLFMSVRRRNRVEDIRTATQRMSSRYLLNLALDPRLSKTAPAALLPLASAPPPSTFATHATGASSAASSASATSTLTRLPSSHTIFSRSTPPSSKPVTPPGPLVSEEKFDGMASVEGIGVTSPNTPEHPLAPERKSSLFIEKEEGATVFHVIRFSSFASSSSHPPSSVA